MITNRLIQKIYISPAAFFILAICVGTGLLSVAGVRAQTHHGHGHTDDTHVAPIHSEPETHDADGNREAHGDDHSGETEALIHLSPAQIREFGIKTASAGPGEIYLDTELPGEIVPDPDRLAHIVPRVPGVTRAVHKKTGDFVKAGEDLAVIESRELADIKADYLTALKHLELSRRHYQREKRLYDRKITSEQEFLDAETAFAEATIRIYGAKQKLMALGLDEQYVDGLHDRPNASLTSYSITAPISGRIIQRNIAAGEVVGPQSDIFTVAELRRVWVNLTVYQKDLGAIEPGQSVTICADKIDAEANGRIDYVSPIVNESTRTATARVILENPDGRWRPGLFVTGRIRSSSVAADIVIPQSAIQTIDGETVVFLKKDHGFQPRVVKAGRYDMRHVEIVSGLEPNTRIAVTQTFMLKAELNKDAIGGHQH